MDAADGTLANPGVLRVRSLGPVRASWHRGRVGGTGGAEQAAADRRAARGERGAEENRVSEELKHPSKRKAGGTVTTTDNKKQDASSKGDRVDEITVLKRQIAQLIGERDEARKERDELLPRA